MYLFSLMVGCRKIQLAPSPVKKHKLKLKVLLQKNIFLNIIMMYVQGFRLVGSHLTPWKRA